MYKMWIGNLATFNSLYWTLTEI